MKSKLIIPVLMCIVLIVVVIAIAKPSNAHPVEWGDDGMPSPHPGITFLTLTQIHYLQLPSTINYVLPKFEHAPSWEMCVVRRDELNAMIINRVGSLDRGQWLCLEGELGQPS